MGASYNTVYPLFVAWTRPIHLSVLCLKIASSVCSYLGLPRSSLSYLLILSKQLQKSLFNCRLSCQSMNFKRAGDVPIGCNLGQTAVLFIKEHFGICHSRPDTTYLNVCMDEAALICEASQPVGFGEVETAGLT